MKKTKNLISDITALIGVLLLVFAAVLLITTEISQKNAQTELQNTLTQLEKALPKSHTSAPDDRLNLTMPAVIIGEKSFCGVIEIPKLSVKLPICETWKKGEIINHPCKYTGNIYDGSLVIGGSGNSGQFDFMKTISNDDTVYVTDMTGGKYTYSVSKIIKTNDVSTEKLQTEDYDLTLFAKPPLSLQYTVVYCNFKN